MMKTRSIHPRANIARSLVSIALIVLLFAASAYTQTATSTDSVETRLTELFDLCKNDETEKAASYFVYRGADKAREWKDTLRADGAAEKAAAKELCRRINGYIDRGQSYSFGEVKIESESEGEWHALEATFYYGSEQRKAIFAFLHINGQFAVGDIDESGS